MIAVNVVMFCRTISTAPAQVLGIARTPMDDKQHTNDSLESRTREDFA
jgi:hypothetical protein